MIQKKELKFSMNSEKKKMNYQPKSIKIVQKRMEKMEQLKNHLINIIKEKM